MRIVLLVMLIWPAVGHARTWRVEKDGSGDYIKIQDAVDAAAVGDTVMIGVGRYDTFHPVPESGAPEDYAIVDIQTDSLTIRGVDKDQVIIGPAARSEKTIQRQGIFALYVAWVDIENISVENIHIGIQVNHSGRVSGCRVRNCKTGIWGTEAKWVEVEYCELIDCDGAGVDAYAYGGGQLEYSVRGCVFQGGGVGIYNASHPHMMVDDCTFNALIGGGVQYVSGGSGVVRNCTIVGGNYGLYVSENCSVELVDSVIRDVIWSAVHVYGGTLSGSGNILHGGSRYTIGISSSRSIDFHNNHIMPGTENSVNIYFYYISDVGVDLTNNYWGTADSAEIASWIWDGNDDQTIQAIVQYEPFSPVPLPKETKTMGDLKSMFR